MFSSEYLRLKNELHELSLREQERQHLLALVILRIAFTGNKKSSSATPPSSSSQSNVRHLVELEVSKIKQESAMKIQTQEAKIQNQEARIRSLDKEIKKLRQEAVSRGPSTRNYLSPTVNSFNKSILSSSPIRQVMTPLKRPQRITKDTGKRKYLNYNKIAQTLTRTQRLERRRKEIDGESDASRISEGSDEENEHHPGSPTPESPDRPKKIRLQKSNSQPPIDNTRTTLGEDDLNSIGYYQDANFTDVSPVRQTSGGTKDVIATATAVPDVVEPKKKRNIFEIE